MFFHLATLYGFIFLEQFKYDGGYVKDWLGGKAPARRIWCLASLPKIWCESIILTFSTAALIFFYHRDMEDTETLFLFAHRETAMGKKTVPSVTLSLLV